MINFSIQSVWVKIDWISVRVTYVAAHLITEVPAVSRFVTLAAAMDTGAVITLELVRTTIRTTYKKKTNG